MGLTTDTTTDTTRKKTMKQANAILGLLAQTSLHAGTGQNTGIIDLPIQREGHNGWPCIFGSAVKGALRTCIEDILTSTSSNSIDFVFGKEAVQGESLAGAVAFSDARLLLFPVRSLTSQFKWVTCPAALKRYQQDAARLGLTINLPIPTPSDDDEAIVDNETDKAVLFLEEYRFNTQIEDLTDIIEMLAALIKVDDAKTLLKKQLTLISDDMFSYIVQHTTPVNAHIAIESATKMVKNGALWYEETLPPESLLYITLSASDARKKEAKQSADTILSVITDTLAATPWLQLGGNETVGMGWCAVSIKEKKGE